MRLFLIALLIVPMYAFAQSSTSDTKSCILAAAAALPHIAGLTIKSSKTRPITPASKEIRAAYVVDVGFLAAGQNETYTYVCGLGYGQPAQVVRITSP